MDIQLFLAHADDHRPVLEVGLPSSATLEAPVPAFAPRPSARHVSTAPPDDLSEQGWALIAPRGPAGDRLLHLVDPLRRRREEQQGAEALIYRVDPVMGPAAASAWIRQDYWDAAHRRAEHLPRYLLLVGEPPLVSWDLQQLLGADAFAGRLAFGDDRGYEAYVDKVLRWEREEAEGDARALFFAVRDGSMAMLEGYRHLLGPSVDLARDRKARGTFLAREILEIGGRDAGRASDGELAGQTEAMLREAASARAGLLFTMSHGVGIPHAGWRSGEEQRAFQGAMVIGRRGQRLAARDIEARPFVPGGVWFFFACYSAGTPQESAYYPWLDRLHKLGWCSSADRVLAALPKSGDAPFVAALPQAALASPDGPLGVIGHVDLAWTWGFLDHDLSPSRAPARTRAERFQGTLRALVEGHRIGVAHHELTRFFRSLSADLAALYDEDARLGEAGSGDADARKARLAGLWMQRQDLGAYVLLGDPAARLPIARFPAGTRPPGLASRALSTEAPDVSKMEAAVMAVLRGGEGTGPIASRFGVSEAELERWAGAFLDAGRSALAKLR